MQAEVKGERGLGRGVTWCLAVIDGRCVRGYADVQIWMSSPGSEAVVIAVGVLAEGRPTVLVVCGRPARN